MLQQTNQESENIPAFARPQKLAEVGRLEPVFHPIVPLPWAKATEVIYELLARVRLRSGDLVSPRTLLERTQLRALDIDHCVLLSLPSLLEQHAGKTLSLNVAPQSLCDDAYYATLRQLLTGTLAPDRLILEITETSLDSPEMEALVLKRMGSIRDQGLRIALDEFGGGKHGLQRLLEAHFDMVKIAKRIDVASEQGRALGELLVVLLKHLSATEPGKSELPISICFTMTEVPQHFDQSVYLGADYVQGYLFGEPSTELPDPNLLIRQVERFVEQAIDQQA